MAQVYRHETARRGAETRVNSTPRVPAHAPDRMKPPPRRSRRRSCRSTLHAKPGPACRDDLRRLVPRPARGHAQARSHGAITLLGHPHAARPQVQRRALRPARPLPRTAASRFPPAGSMATPCSASTTAGALSPAPAAAKRFPRSPRTTTWSRRRSSRTASPSSSAMATRGSTCPSRRRRPHHRRKRPCRPVPELPKFGRRAFARRTCRPTCPATSTTASSA